MSRAARMPRTVEPEWLDRLPATDPRAAHARRDLRIVNAVMRNARFVAAALAGRIDRPRAIVDIGAGDGAWLVELARVLPPGWTRVKAVLLDRQDSVSARRLAALTRRGWVPEVITADVLDWLAQPESRADVYVANLFLHHFEPPRLSELLALVAGRCSVFAACEPRRSPFALHASRLLGLLGCNAVTRHDALASVRAGFADDDLTALWPRVAGWRLEEGSRGGFSHLFVAARTRAEGGA